MSGRLYSLCIMGALLAGLCLTAFIADRTKQANEALVAEATATMPSRQLQQAQADLGTARQEVMNLRRQLRAVSEQQRAVEGFERLLVLCGASQ